MNEYLAGGVRTTHHGMGDDGAQWVARQSTDARRRREMEQAQDATEREQLLEAVVERLKAVNVYWNFCQLCDAREGDEHATDCPLPALDAFDARHGNTPAHSGEAGLSFGGMEPHGD